MYFSALRPSKTASTEKYILGLVFNLFSVFEIG